MKGILTLVLSILLFPLLYGQNVKGNWYGLVDSFAIFELKIDRDSDNWQISCNYLSPWQRYIGVPSNQAMVNGDTLTVEFTINEEEVRFQGTYNDEAKKIDGVYEVLNFSNSWPITLERNPIKEPPSWQEISSGPVTPPTYTRHDTLRGSITPERAWWDLTYYHLDIKVNPADSTIEGSNTVQYKVLEPSDLLQIDLQSPLNISKVTQEGLELAFTRDSNVYLIQLQKKQEQDAVEELVIYYSGKPHVAQNPPWDGGFTWAKDSMGKPFAATSCQIDGASLWWPNKDHMYDEVDSMLISINVPPGLIGVGNGRLRSTDTLKDGSLTYHWFVNNPINNYGVNVNIADYVHFSEQFSGEKGVLDCDYYVLRNNLEKAKKHFKQVPLMLQALEHWFGPYPFYEDGYKLVETPYLGMEHQSSVTYGNDYQNGYRGSDLSDSGWGLKFDFIIIHESGHEWFANSITYRDVADFWIHESFITLSESLYLEYHFGKAAAQEYLIGIRKRIRNDQPMIGDYDVNFPHPSGDNYGKGANMLHMLRQIVDDDEKWRAILRGLNRDFYHQTVTTQQIESYIAEKTGLQLDAFWDQYLRTTNIPTLEYFFSENQLHYRWINCNHDFDMPVRIHLDNETQWIHPKAFVWTDEYLEEEKGNLMVDPNFYVSVFKTR